MASQSQPITPVRVPKAATAYTPQTQDPDLRSQINTVLLREGHIEKIQHTLHHALHAHPSNWPAKIAAHALDLLRSGECTTFPKLMERVLADVRRDTEAAARLLNNTTTNNTPPDKTTASTATATTKTDAKAKGKPNGTAKGKAAAAAAAGVNGVIGVSDTLVVPGSGAGKADLALPQTVVEEGIKVTRECLELVCEIV